MTRPVTLAPPGTGRTAARPARVRPARVRTARVRAVAAGAAALTVVTALVLRAVTTGDVAKYGGDALYTVLLLALVVLAAPRVAPLKAASCALAASWAVEFLQLTPAPAELSRHSTVARLVLGSTFNPPDLFWYAAGAAAGWLLHTGMRRRRARP
ncbi:ribosomal maturation YjgA family protein [Streptomyces xanthophaeus]|uniref:ribosomal maturation YjgA family protein n=1 Tax=Streptomyces xanthophaeus TaxID=67385 RepID=UPI00371F6C34